MKKAFLILTLVCAPAFAGERPPQFTCTAGYRMDLGMRKFTATASEQRRATILALSRCNRAWYPHILAGSCRLLGCRTN